MTSDPPRFADPRHAANPASIIMADNQGHTLNHIAWQGGNLDVVKCVIGLEKDLFKAIDLGGNLHLHYFCMMGNCEFIYSPHN